MPMTKQINYHTIRLFIVNSTISTGGLSILTRDYPILFYTIELSNVTFNRNGVKLEML